MCLSIIKETEDWDFPKNNWSLSFLSSKYNFSRLHEFSEQKFNIILETKVPSRYNSSFSYSVYAKQSLHNQQEVTQVQRSLQHHTAKEENTMSLWSLSYICNEVWNFSPTYWEHICQLYKLSRVHYVHLHNTWRSGLFCFLRMFLKHIMAILVLKNPWLSARNNIGMILSTLLANHSNYAIGIISRSLKILYICVQN